jgi:hypothetical protein
MTVRGRWATTLAVAALGVAVFVLGGFLLRAGLQRADQWASVFGLFLNIAGLVTAAAGLRQARRASGPTDRDIGPPGAPAGGVTNTISGGRFHGPVTMGRDITDPPGNSGR